MTKKILVLLAIVVASLNVAGCSSGPRDATNDPDVQYMLKGVNEQGKMPGGGAPTPISGGAAPSTPTVPSTNP